MLKSIAFILLNLFLNFLTAYSQQVLSVNPLYTEHVATLIPETESIWHNRDFNLSVTVKRTGDNFYLLKYGDANNLSQYEGVFVSIANTILLDLVPKVPDTLGDNDFRSQLLPEHSFYKVKIEKDTLQLAELNYGWFYKQIAKNKSLLSHTWVGGGLLLTISTKELNQFIQEHINEPGFFDESTSFAAQHATKIGKKQVGSLTTKNNPQNYNQQCIPVFPHKDGWLGGDGDVSVQVSKTQTLFIFSDSYVGNKNQRSRLEPGMKMVSNTVEVETCLPGRKTDVHYFWNNMYGNNPAPIFKSFTNRYIYWVNDAFMYKACLYVLLEKIAPKQGAAPDDFFKFSSAGFTVAKIVNPLDPPLQWQIELIPLPDFVNPQMGIRTHTILEKYIYFFVSHNDNAQFLVRKNLDLIDNPEKPFEYYASNKTWRTGINIDDMDTVIHGFRSNSVNYHPDIKQWVMVSDIKFLDNKIKIRTSSSLTGPWSEEKIIYECPEVTPGTTSYSKSNFCYLSRECIQNYDSNTHTMFITYDINNSSFSEINSNPKIYTPKVITVSLKKYVR